MPNIYHYQNIIDVHELLILLSNRYPIYFQQMDRIEEILGSFSPSISDITVIVEENHIDRQYRDSYYAYFSQKFSEYPRNCLRLAFFEDTIEYDWFKEKREQLEEKKFIGTVVLRPLNVGNVGLTLLNPNKLDCQGYVQTCRFKLHICGAKLSVRAFPYMSQDNDTMSCAETALFNLMTYYGEKYSEYRVWMPSEILKALEEVAFQRVLPSTGLRDTEMAKVLKKANFYPRLYTKVQDFDELVHAYVESGIPFILGLPQHTVICIGHCAVDFGLKNHDLKDACSDHKMGGNTYYYLGTSKLIDKYIFMDDNRRPYVMDTIDNITLRYYHATLAYREDMEEIDDALGDMEDTCEDHCPEGSTQVNYSEEYMNPLKYERNALLVPLYRRIFVEASRAKSIFEELFLFSENFITEIQKAYDDPTWGMDVNNPLVWRMYLASSNSYRDFQVLNAYNDKICKLYTDYPYPRFIWVMEIGTLSTFQNGDGEARVEIILDATSSENSSTWGILSVRYFGHLYCAQHFWSKDTEGQMYSSLDDHCSDSGTEKQPHVINMLTNMYYVLYNSRNIHCPETFKIFKTHNLKETW